VEKEPISVLRERSILINGKTLIKNSKLNQNNNPIEGPNFVLWRSPVHLQKPSPQSLNKR
jgi:hypothetical protein